MQLILASSSRYRRELLSRMDVPFTHLSPDVDERPQDRELPGPLARRLAHAKARAGAGLATITDPAGALVIGSDQVATLDGRIALGKPGNYDNAHSQLRSSSGQSVVFHTAVCLLRTTDKAVFTDCVDTRVDYRELTDETIDAYLRAEQPYDCAGAAKSEGLGISLLRSINGPDPTALIGLPLIALTSLLAQAGFAVLGRRDG